MDCWNERLVAFDVDDFHVNLQMRDAGEIGLPQVVHFLRKFFLSAAVPKERHRFRDQFFPFADVLRLLTGEDDLALHFEFADERGQSVELERFEIHVQDAVGMATHRGKDAGQRRDVLAGKLRAAEGTDVEFLHVRERELLHAVVLLRLRNFNGDAFEIRIMEANDRAVLRRSEIALRRYTVIPRPRERFERVFRHRGPGAAMGLDVVRRRLFCVRLPCGHSTCDEAYECELFRTKLDTALYVKTCHQLSYANSISDKPSKLKSYYTTWNG